MHVVCTCITYVLQCEFYTCHMLRHASRMYIMCLCITICILYVDVLRFCCDMHPVSHTLSMCCDVHPVRICIAYMLRYKPSCTCMCCDVMSIVYVYLLRMCCDVHLVCTCILYVLRCSSFMYMYSVCVNDMHHVCTLRMCCYIHLFMYMHCLYVAMCYLTQEQVFCICNGIHSLRVGLGGSVGCASDWRPGGRGFDPRRGRQHSFAEIDHEIFSTVILSLPLIQERQLSECAECAQYWVTA